jgi:hypothetical protein
MPRRAHLFAASPFPGFIGYNGRQSVETMSSFLLRQRRFS